MGGSTQHTIGLEFDKTFFFGDKIKLSVLQLIQLSKSGLIFLLLLFLCTLEKMIHIVYVSRT